VPNLLIWKVDKFMLKEGEELEMILIKEILSALVVRAI
jgi:hypothetical protein